MLQGLSIILYLLDRDDSFTDGVGFKIMKYELSLFKGFWEKDRWIGHTFISR